MRTEEINVKLRTLHAGQERFNRVCDEHIYTTAVLGRRWGKTYACIDRLFTQAMGWKGSQPFEALWVAPTFDLSSIAWREWHRFIPRKLFTSNKTEHVIELTNGAVIYFRSADREDSLIGRGYDLVILDEAARIPEDRITREVLPALADRNGKAIAITTPRGKRNWAYRWYAKGKDPLQNHYGAINGPSDENPNPFIREWVNRMKPVELGGEGDLPLDVYRQEILAEFLEDAAAVFRNVRASVNNDLEVKDWCIGKPDVIGLDVARHQDYTVLTGLKEVNGKMRIVSWDRFHRMPWPVMMQRIQDASVAAGDPPVILDATGIGDKVFDDLMEADVQVIPFVFTTQSKQKLVQGGAMSIEQDLVEMPNIPVLIDELEGYTYEISPNGSFRYDAPEGMHSDAAISLLLALWGSKQLGRSADLRFFPSVAVPS